MMVDRAGWDQSFIDSSGGGAASTTAGRVSPAGDVEPSSSSSSRFCRSSPRDGDMFYQNGHVTLPTTASRKPPPPLLPPPPPSEVVAAEAVLPPLSSSRDDSSSSSSSSSSELSRLAAAVQSSLSAAAAGDSSNGTTTHLRVDQPPCRPSTSPANTPMTTPAVVSSPRTVASASYSVVASFLPAWDVERLESVYRRLATCGFYYGRMSVDEAAAKLAMWPVGTFLLRDSSDERYMFSVSVQTSRGTTSIRMSYRSGLFRLDCHPDQEHLMPTFDCALRLLRHYVGLCRRSSPAAPSSTMATAAAPPAASSAPGTTPLGHGYVLLEATGRRDTPVLLRAPYRHSPPSLGHLSRLNVNRALCAAAGSKVTAASATDVDRLQLLPSLKNFLKDYPYDV